MESNYVRVLANTLNEEGGWTNDPHDPGGPTMYGIIQREYNKHRAKHGLPQQSVRYITQQELQDIYRGNYWNPTVGAEWPKGPDQIVFDIAVNSGLGRANKIMGYAIGTSAMNYATQAALAAKVNSVDVVKRACARRASFYRSLGTFAYFGRGWLSRNARMEAIGVKMALEDANTPRTDIHMKANGQLAKERSTRAGRAAAGTGSSGAAGGAGATQLDVAHWDWTVWVTFGMVAVGAVALTLFLVWAWKKHGERAKAYALAAENKLEMGLAGVVSRIHAMKVG